MSKIPLLALLLAFIVSTPSGQLFANAAPLQDDGGAPSLREKLERTSAELARKNELIAKLTGELRKAMSRETEGEEKLRRAWAGGAAIPRATVRATVDIVASARLARVPMRLRATRAPTKALSSAAARATAVGTRALRLERAIVAVEPGRA